MAAKFCWSNICAPATKPSLPACTNLARDSPLNLTHHAKQRRSHAPTLSAQRRRVSRTKPRVILSAAKNLTHSNGARPLRTKAVLVCRSVFIFRVLRRLLPRSAKNFWSAVTLPPLCESLDGYQVSGSAAETIASPPKPPLTVILRSAFRDEGSQPCSRIAIDATKTGSERQPGRPVTG